MRFSGSGNIQGTGGEATDAEPVLTGLRGDSFRSLSDVEEVVQRACAQVDFQRTLQLARLNEEQTYQRLQQELVPTPPNTHCLCCEGT